MEIENFEIIDQYEAIKRYKISRATLWSWRARGILKPVPPTILAAKGRGRPRAIYFFAADVEAAARRYCAGRGKPIAEF